MTIKHLFLLISLFLSISIFGARIDTLRVQSASMNKTISNIVIIPDSYNENNSALPVLYLLHGAGGNYKAWISRAPKLREYVDLYNFIIVCPDGGITSWYFDSPIDPSMKYETYVSKELIQAVEQKYNPSRDKAKRAVTGLSMGGHGAFYLAFRHPEIYGAAGSMSGGVDLRPFPNNWEISQRLGSYSENPEAWEKNSVINMVHLIGGKDLKLIMDCGINDFFFDANQRLHQKLKKRNIPHDYIERPGVHNWDYWKESIKYQLLFFHNFFNESQVP